MANKKFTWLLILQGWTMLWVVIGHSPLPILQTSVEESYIFVNISNILKGLAYSFHMPLFIMISGYLFFLTRIQKPMSYKAMVIDKAKRLGIPYFFFITAAFLLKCVSIGEMNREVEITWNCFLKGFIFPYSSALQEMWFIATIFLYFLLREVYRQLLEKRILRVAALIIAIGMNYIPVDSVTDFLVINRAIHFFIYFYIGILIASQKLDKRLRNKYSMIISAVIFCLSFPIHNELLTALSGCSLFWGLASLASNCNKKLFSSFRDYTYQIFLLGIFIQIAVKLVYGHLAMPITYIIFYLLCILSGIYIPVIVAKSINGTNCKILKMLLGL